MKMCFSISVENDVAEDAELCAQTERLLESIDLSPVHCLIDQSLAVDVGEAIGAFVNQMKAIERRAKAIRRRQ